MFLVGPKGGLEGRDGCGILLKQPIGRRMYANFQVLNRKKEIQNPKFASLLLEVPPLFSPLLSSSLLSSYLHSFLDFGLKKGPKSK